jgi:hypothetical protein
MPDINETSWDRERPIGGRLPYEAANAYQRKGGAITYHGTDIEAPSADHLTVFWDEELIYVRDRLYLLYDLMFDPDKCDAIYLDWLASLVGFQDTSQYRYNGVGSGNPGEYNYVDHHDINELSAMRDKLADVGGDDYRLVRSPKFAAEGGLKTNPNFSNNLVNEPSFLAYPSYINHSDRGDIISVPPPDDWQFKLYGVFWRNDFPEGLKRWLIANAFTKVWNYLGSNELLNQIFTRASLIVTITGDRVDWNIGTSRIGVDVLTEFVPFRYWLRVPPSYVRGEYYWRFVEFIDRAYGSAVCQSRVCYDGFYPDLSYPGEPPTRKIPKVYIPPLIPVQNVTITIADNSCIEGNPVSFVQNLTIALSSQNSLEDSYQNLTIALSSQNSLEDS